MSGEELCEALRALLESHPNLVRSKAGHVAHAERRRTLDEDNIGFEPERTRHQNLYVEARSVRLTQLSGIKHQRYFAKDYGTTRPNHNLFHKDAFGDVDIIRFEINALWEAVRVVAEVAGMVGRR